MIRAIFKSIAVAEMPTPRMKNKTDNEVDATGWCYYYGELGGYRDA